MTGSIPARDFYSEFHGHKVRYLEQLLLTLRAESDRIIWTAGDSSLDNKYWFSDTSPAVGGYREALHPPRSKQDVTFWLNHLLEENERSGHSGALPRTAAINAAVEATTLNERTFRLRPQDVFLRDNLQPQDILVVSVGGNDVALRPLPCTIASTSALLCCMPSSCIEFGFSCGVVPFDDCCMGCGPSLASCACSCPPCLGYYKHLFGVRVQSYISALTAKTKPAKILVCMIYYPDEADQPGWAGPVLGALGYNSNPGKLQALIRKGFQQATSTIKIAGSQVIPVPLFHVLDGKNTGDYVARVEPSPSGGRKMAEFILDLALSSSSNSLPVCSTSAAPSPGYMRERS